jgi:hypothetical protein
MDLEQAVGLLGRQSGFCQTIVDPLDVSWPLERLPAEVFFEGVFWIDLSQFAPDRLFEPPTVLGIQSQELATVKITIVSIDVGRPAAGKPRRFSWA